MTPEALAQIAYEAYCVDRWNHEGRWPTPWRDLKELRDSWIAAAQAVKANVLSGFTKVGEGESNQP